MKFDQKIYIEEQGMRDGLQTLSIPLSLEIKQKWIDMMVEAGIRRIQLGSFVNPKLVPMMADTGALFNYVANKNWDNVVFSALVLNKKGLEIALDAGVKHLSISMSASNTHSLKNVNKTKDEAKKELEEMINFAKKNNLNVRSGIQCAFGCRVEGKIDKAEVLALAKFILDLGADEISLADSTGMANPAQIEEIIGELKENVNHQLIGLHLHNTENKGYANLYAGLRSGVNIFDTAFGGLGGCPFIKGATGNIATEDTVHLLHQMGIDTGIDIHKIAEISSELCGILGTELPGYMYNLIKRKDLKFI